MTYTHISTDYCIHGVGIDCVCVECERWYVERGMSDEFRDEFGFAYRVDADDTDDDDAYPPEETLDLIASWPCASANDVRQCLDVIKSAWNNTYGSVEIVHAPHELSMLLAQKGERFLRFATGGWSGNESLIAALKRNIMINSFSWRLSARGGLHIYRY